MQQIPYAVYFGLALREVAMSWKQQHAERYVIRGKLKNYASSKMY